VQIRASPGLATALDGSHVPWWCSQTRAQVVETIGASGTPSSGEPRTTSAVARAAQRIPDLHFSLRTITHVALNLPTPSSSCFDPRSIDFDGTPTSPEPRRRGFWSPASSTAARALRPNPSRPIRSEQSRLDSVYPFDRAVRSKSSGPDSVVQIRPSHPDRTVRFPRADRTVRTPPFRSDRPNWNASKPSNPNPTAQIRRYPFGLAILLKSPWTLLESTRSPALFKSNCRSA
jgi:hypothetical protein